MVDFIKAIKRPYTQKNSKNILIKSIIPFLNLAMFGYILECARLSIKGKYNLPDWKKKGWFEYIANSFKLVFGIVLYYSAIPIVLAISILFYMKQKTLLTSKNLIFSIKTLNIILSNPLLLGLAIVTLVLALYAWYIIPAATIEFIKNWKYKEGQNTKKIRKMIFTKEYFKAWLIMSIFSLVVTQIINYVIEYIPYGSLFRAGLVPFIVQIPFLTVIAEVMYKKK